MRIGSCLTVTRRNWDKSKTSQDWTNTWQSIQEKQYMKELSCFSVGFYLIQFIRQINQYWNQKKNDCDRKMSQIYPLI
jgi:hypothetical protein